MPYVRPIAKTPENIRIAFNKGQLWYAYKHAEVATDKGLTFMEKWLPDGRGVRLNMDGTFKGFID